MDDDFSIDRRDLTDQVYDRLKAQILDRNFSPNEKLSVDRVAKRFGISRTPAKDAMNRLAAEGLITIERRVGSFVTPITIKDIEEIFAMRLLFELYAAEKGFGIISVDEISEMELLLQDMATCIEGDRYRPSDHGRYIELDHKLHRLIVDSTGNDRLIAMYEGLDVHVHITRAYYLNDMENAVQSQQAHQAIVLAYRERNLKKLKKVLQSHILSVRDLVIQKLESAGGIL